MVGAIGVVAFAVRMDGQGEVRGEVLTFEELEIDALIIRYVALPECLVFFLSGF